MPSFLLRQPPSGHVIEADADGDGVLWDATLGLWVTGPVGGKPDGGVLQLQGGGEPSLVTFSECNTFKAGTASPGVVGSFDAAIWELEDPTIATLKYVSTTPRAYLMLAAVALEGFDTTTAALASAGISLNGDLLGTLLEDQVAKGAMATMVEPDLAWWLHTFRYVELEADDEVSLCAAQNGDPENPFTRTARGFYLQWAEIKEIT